MSSDDTDFDPAYIAGLLDATGRVRFEITVQDNNNYTIRPQLQVHPHLTEQRTAVLGSFFESRDYQFRLANRGNATPVFRLGQRSDLEDLRNYLADESASLIRELEFIFTVFQDTFDFEILNASEMREFLHLRNNLHYDWKPRGRRHFIADDVSGGQPPDISALPEIPLGPLRSSYDRQWGIGFFEGAGRYRPSISQSPEYTIGYTIYPLVFIFRPAVHPAAVNYVRQFMENVGIEYGDTSEYTQVRISVSGSDSVELLLTDVEKELLVLAPHTQYILTEVLPQFEEDAHRTKNGFYSLMSDMMEVAGSTHGPFSPDTYTLEYYGGRCGVLKNATPLDDLC